MIGVRVGCNSLEENVIVALLVQDVASLVEIDTLREHLRLEQLGLLAGDAFFVLQTRLEKVMNKLHFTLLDCFYIRFSF